MIKETRCKKYNNCCENKLNVSHSIWKIGQLKGQKVCIILEDDNISLGDFVNLTKWGGKYFGSSLDNKIVLDVGLLELSKGEYISTIVMN